MPVADRLSIEIRKLVAKDKRRRVEEIPYELTFDETVAQVSNLIEHWFAGPRNKLPEIDSFPDPIYFKSSNTIIVHSNTAYHDFFSRGMAAVGRLATSFLDNSVLRASEHSDALILEGTSYVKFEHHCIGPENRWYKLLTFKKGLLHFQDGAFDILGISRPIAIESESVRSANELQDAYGVYKRLDASDQRICNLIAEGRSSKEIARILEVTPKTIENRRRRILGSFQFDKVIDIIKTMVRFEERGFEL